MLYLTTDQYVGRSLDLYGEYSEGEVEFFDQMLKPGHIVLEAGANIGAHTVYFAKTVGPRGTVIALSRNASSFKFSARMSPDLDWRG